MPARLDLLSQVGARRSERALRVAEVLLVMVAAVVTVAWATGAVRGGGGGAATPGKRGSDVEDHHATMAPSRADLAGWQPRSDLFGRPAPPRQVHTAPPMTLAKLASRYRLTGIILGDSPQAILVDGGSRQALYVSEGQMLEGGVVVGTIESHRIVLLYGDESMELKL